MTLPSKTGDERLTTGDKLHQTLVSMRGAKTDMEAFAMETTHKKAEQLFNQGEPSSLKLVNQVSQRTNDVEIQEPQYKVKKKQNSSQQRQ